MLAQILEAITGKKVKVGKMVNITAVKLDNLQSCMRAISKMSHQSGMQIDNLSAMDFYRGKTKAIEGFLLKLMGYYPSKAELARRAARKQQLELTRERLRIQKAERLAAEKRAADAEVRAQLEAARLEEERMQLEIDRLEQIEAEERQHEMVVEQERLDQGDAEHPNTRNTGVHDPP